MKTLLSALTLTLLLATSAAALPTVVNVTTCGQVIPKRAIGLLAAGLDCRGFAAGRNGATILVEKGATFDLRGFSLTGGENAIGCFTQCAPTRPDCYVPTKCTIKNGTVQEATNVGIIGGNLTIDGVTVRANGVRGVEGGRKTKLTNVTITENGNSGALADRLFVQGSTITGNGEFGVAAIVAKVTESTVVDNGTSPACAEPATATCYDIGSIRRPNVRDTTCERSFAFSSLQLGDCSGPSWCICSEDPSATP